MKITPIALKTFLDRKETALKRFHSINDAAKEAMLNDELFKSYIPTQTLMFKSRNEWHGQAKELFEHITLSFELNKFQATFLIKKIDRVGKNRIRKI